MSSLFSETYDQLVGDLQYVSKHKHAFEIYLAMTAALIFGIFAATQVVAIKLWPETEAPLVLVGEAMVPWNDAVPAEALHTNVPWYVYTLDTPTSWMSDQEFLRYVTVVLWLVVCITGLGMEVVLGEPLVAKLAGSDALAPLWQGAQLAFSLSVSIGLFAQSPFGFPWAVVGLWKFGFPETIGCFRRAFRIRRVSMESVNAYLNGVGTLVHHASCAYLVVACATHLMPLDRRVVAGSLPLVTQHLFVLLKYLNMPVYVLCELALEVVWEIETIRCLKDLSVENGYDITTRGCACSMLLAHWCYWAAALAAIPSLIYGRRKTASAEMRDLAADESGMDLAEFLGVIAANHIPLTKQQARQLFKEHDKDFSGALDRKEVEDLVKSLLFLIPDLDDGPDDKEEILESLACQTPRTVKSTRSVKTIQTAKTPRSVKLQFPSSVPPQIPSAETSESVLHTMV